MKAIKQFVVDVRSTIKYIRQQEFGDKNNEDSIIKFIFKDLELSCQSSESELIKVSTIDDLDLSRRNKELPDLRIQFDSFIMNDIIFNSETAEKS